MVGKDTITGMGFIGLEHGRLYKMRRGPKVIIATITGRRIVLEKCAGGKLRGLILYGKSTQVTTTGAQLFEPISDSLNLNGVVITLGKNSEQIVVSGTPTLSQEIQISKPIQMQAGEKYVLTFDENHYFENIWVRGNGVSFGWSGKNTTNRVIIIVPDSFAERTDCVMYASVSEGKAYNFTINHLMLNAGDTALPWEPYTGGKPSPSPDYPQEIVSAKGEVVVHGKNIFGGRYYYANYANSILIINGNKKEEEVKLPYAPEYESFGVCKVIKCKKGKTYVISVTNPNKNANIGMAEYENIENASAYTKNVGFARMTNKTKQLYTAKSDGILVCGIAGTWTDGKTTVHECTESELLQVEEASEATSYEPYHNPQTLTLSAPNGLPGIMVTSGGNYTDENGQQWICDEVDFAGGVYRQRIKHVNIVFNKVASSATHSGYRHMAGDIQNMSREHTECLCNIATHSQNAAYGTEGVRASGAYNALVLYYENLTLDNVPADVAYILSDPIETPLSETDIAAYRALTIYDPTTVVETNSGGLKVSYNKIVKKLVEERSDLPNM